MGKMHRGEKLMKLRRELSQLPITALDFYTSRLGNVYLLAGEDTRLAVYAVEPATEQHSLCRSEDIFYDQPLHGIRVQEPHDGESPRAIVWGSSDIAMLDVSALDTQVRAVDVVARGTAPDWIYDAAVSPWDSSLAVVITAHNEVVPCRVDASGTIVFGALTSPSRPMLYNGRLAWLSSDTLLVAAGTVFGDVVVWKYHFAADDEMGRGRHEMLCTLTGHEGSIYGVDISPEMAGPGGESVRLLASCSDDRTIRIWDIATERPSTLSEIRPSEAPETGFRPTPEYDAQATGEEDGARPVATAMGHVSRIWGVKFGLPGTCDTLDSAVPVYSFGEDATAQRWQLELHSAAGRGKKPLGELVHKQTYSLHNGKHIWAGAVLCRDEATLIATGGGDGKIGLITEPSSEQPTAQNLPRGVITADMRDVLDSTRPGLAAGREMISRYDFITEDQVLAITNLGRLFVGALSTGITWREIKTSDEMTAELRLTYVFRAVHDGAAVLGTTDGKIFYVRGADTITRVAQVPGRIIEASVLSKGAFSTASGSPVQILVHLHGSSESCYITIDSDGGSASYCRTKGLDSRFVATSAAKLGELLIMGSRHGWISLLRKQGDAWRPVCDVATRSRDAITSIVALPPRTDLPTASKYFLATSRDGKYRIYELEQDGQSPQLHLLHETAPPFGPMIEGAWFTHDAVDPELVLYGFRSKDFVIWNETRREEIAMVDCGGAHRTFRLWSSASDPGRYHFAFTRTSKLSVYSQARTPHCTLRNGTHGREIRALSSRGRYLASGAEDTSIRIWEYRETTKPGQTEMRCLASIKSHVTGIQRLQFLDDEYLFSSAGNEEFFVWKIRVLDSAYRGLAVMCEGVFADKSPSGDLRIMDFDVCRWDSGGGGDDTAGMPVLLVTLAFSNSAVKTYRYGPGGGRFEPYAQGFYTGACLTQVRHLGVCGGNGWIMTASTDGHLALWREDLINAQGNITRTWVLMEAARVHQSSIKSLDMARGRGGDDGFCVVTGGDDNALGVATVMRKGGGGFTLAERGIVRRAHAAAINGVVALTAAGDGDDDDDEDGITVVSVSNDQRVRAWRIVAAAAAAADPSSSSSSSSLSSPRVELVCSAFSGVADPGDVACVSAPAPAPASRDSGGGDWQRPRRVVLGGVGIEVWNLAASRTDGLIE
ncbi:WD repeat-containing protein 6 [Purpureocillium takamizusanense]|uniref:WD repeat-containing protein 6 n=1 Tax=Purpureocillium takamizusanense TaxID=2060973 RepID=A0A9Q8VG49_9HYPO|nr:WD repeat-containing protein 6 [Purpureocillium takamizusanense]UNI23477.1 WD repeat-containing protein 6 [Purpureocillium takamizusanense]